MAKQKSGLGRGLNALFDEASQPAHQTPVKKPASEDTAAAQKDQETVKTATQQSSSTPLQAASPQPANTPQTPQKGEPVSTSAAEPASDIYISEDALEHAKVVSREARKTPQTARTTRVTTNTSAPKPTTQPAVAQQRQVEAGAGQKGAATTTLPHKVATNTTSNQVKPPAQKVQAILAQDKGDTGVIAIDKIQPNPDQPRTNFKQEEIIELANSIKKEGLLQPILVRRVGDHYQIIAGERRWQACKTLQMKEIPVRFWKADSDKALELALIENIQRTDLNPIEEAYGYKRLMERKGMTQSEVAQTVSKGRSTIANALRLLDLPEEAQQLLFEEKISAGHARAILSVPTAEGRKTLTKKLMNEKLSVRETEAIARLLAGRAQAETSGTTKRAATPASFKKAARGLTRFFSAPVRVKTVQGKNKIEIQFKDEEELERILSLIVSTSQESAPEEDNK